MVYSDTFAQHMYQKCHTDTKKCQSKSARRHNSLLYHYTKLFLNFMFALFCLRVDIYLFNVSPRWFLLIPCLFEKEDAYVSGEMSVIHAIFVIYVSFCY